MKKHSRILTTATFFAACAATSANLVPNGSFEVNTAGGGFNDTSDGWTTFAGSPDTWDNLGVNGNAPGTLGYMPDITSFDGSKWIGLGGASSSGFREAVESSSFGLSAGQEYSISLAMAYDDSSSFLYINSAPIDIWLRQAAGTPVFLGSMASNTSPDLWEVRTLNFTAGASASFSLIIENDGPNPSYLAVDAVRLVAVPEPATIVTLGLGAASLICKRRGRASSDGN